MTDTQIKQSRAAGNSDWEILSQVIASGKEFPDAVYKVSAALRMDSEQRDEMVDRYDNCI